VRAYDTYGRAQQQLPLGIGDSTLPDVPATKLNSVQPLAKPQ
jgi:phosphate starvation-inducible PhoH-like protein